MKNLVITCGMGLASSALMMRGIEDLFARKGIVANMIKCNIDQLDRHMNEADCIVTSVPIEQTGQIPVVLGTGFLTGIGVTELEAELLSYFD